MAWSSVTRTAGVCGAVCAGACANAHAEMKIAKALSAIKGRHFRVLNFTFMGILLLEAFKSIEPALGKMQSPEAARQIGKCEFEIGQRRYIRRSRRANYAEGGARGAVCEKAGPAAEITSSGSGRDATGFRSATHREASGWM